MAKKTERRDGSGCRDQGSCLFVLPSSPMSTTLSWVEVYTDEDEYGSSADGNYGSSNDETAHNDQQYYIGNVNLRFSTRQPQPDTCHSPKTARTKPTIGNSNLYCLASMFPVQIDRSISPSFVETSNEDGSGNDILALEAIQLDSEPLEVPKNASSLVESTSFLAISSDEAMEMLTSSHVLSIRLDSPVYLLKGADRESQEEIVSLVNASSNIGSSVSLRPSLIIGDTVELIQQACKCEHEISKTDKSWIEKLSACSVRFPLVITSNIVLFALGFIIGRRIATIPMIT